MAGMAGSASQDKKTVKTKGKLVVLEGIDGSGKSTQYGMLCSRLAEEGRDFRRIVFPRYEEESSALVRAYLRGDFGKNPSDVNAYAASAFYAVDRYASYKSGWQDYYESGGLVLADRYTTSNACHQGCKVPEPERDSFFQWLYTFEFRLLGLPEPSLVVYLDTEVETAAAALRRRQLQEGVSGDIHEKDWDYLQKCLEVGRKAADHYGWRRVQTLEKGQRRTVEDIHREIYSLLFSGADVD